MIEGRRVRLRAVRSSDRDWLYELHERAGVLALARTGGGEMRPDHLDAYLWTGVLCQFICEVRESSERFGTVVCYDHRPRDRVASVAAIMIEPGGASSLEPFSLFVDHLFQTYRLRKVYGEVSAAQIGKMSQSLARYMELEATLHDWDLGDDGWQDRFIFSLSRSTWIHNNSVLKVRKLARELKQVIGIDDTSVDGRPNG